MGSQTLEDIQKFNPGPFTYEWLEDEKATEKVEAEEFQYIGDPEIEYLDLNKEVDKLFLVKWRNCSYLEATWEKESAINCPEKISDFKLFNRYQNV